MNRWKRVAASLVRLAEDQCGKPEGDVARQKLQQILAKYPAARRQPEVLAFMQREIGETGRSYPDFSEVKEGRMSMAEFFRMKRAGIDTEGSWTGRDFDDAVRKMEQELRQRMSDVMQAAIRRAMETHRRRFDLHFAQVFTESRDQTTAGSYSFRHNDIRSAMEEDLDRRRKAWDGLWPERYDKPE